MSKIYTVKSNARRDCKKMGIDPERVVTVEGGFMISKEPSAEVFDRVTTDLPADPTPTPVPTPKKRGSLEAMLADWVSLPALMSMLGWQAHTVRGAISTLAKKKGLEIERRREDGVTSYRVKL